VIAVCERLAIVTAATVKLRDFANVRPRHVAALATVPEDPLAARRTRTMCSQQFANDVIGLLAQPAQSAATARYGNGRFARPVRVAGFYN
jgi:hypothetical protein